MSDIQKIKRSARARRHRRVRARVHGTAARPRLALFRSQQWISAQLIDDVAARTLVGIFEKKESLKGKPVDRARALGELFATRAKEKGVTAVVFDRAGYVYHGRVAAFADGARKGGLEF